MAHTLPALSYAFDALEPHLDAQTMQIHHGKHHQAYVNNLNAAIEKAPELAAWSLDQLCRDIAKVPESVRGAVRNNGGGHWNHTMFWGLMVPKSGGAPSGNVAPAIDKAHLALEKKDGAGAIALLKPALLPEASPELRSVGVQLLGYALALEGKWDEVVPLLEAERELLSPEDLARFARVARDEGRGEDGERIEALARASEPLDAFKG